MEYRQWELYDTIEAIIEIADAHHASPAQVALACLLAEAAVC
jgi:hypothetical protein